jgi:hypothetical protein
VVEHPRSALFQQAENRLHAQKALMVGLFNSPLLKKSKPRAARKPVVATKSEVRHARV